MLGINQEHMLLCLVMLVTILQTVTCQQWNPWCPKACRCSLDRSPQQTYSLGPGVYKLVDCRYGNLFSIPAGLPPDTQVLLMSNNFLNTITPQQLEQVPQLKKIDLSHNYLTEIQDGVFKFNINLKLVNLGWNQLKTVASTAFDGLSSLSRLLLSSNQLVDVPRAIQNLVSLVLLELSRNQIVAIEPSAFTGLPRLQFLNLRSNQLEMVAPQTFSGLPSLVNLHLTANKLKMLPPNLFSNLNNLADISLGMNDLEQLPANIFRGLPRVRNIDLHNNKLHRLPWNLFQGTASLQEIDLQGNNILQFPPAIFRGLTNLRTIEITGNDLIHPLPPALFWGLRSLESVHLHLVQNVPDTLFHYVPQLSRLEISESDIPILSDRMFQNLPNLQTLILSDNGIGMIPPGTFHRLAQLSTLDLSANALTALNETTFGSMPSLTELFLQDNLLASASRGAFSGLTGLQTLRLEVNLLQEIRADALPQGAAIKALQLADNPLQRIDGAIFNRLQALTHLTISSNRLICDCHMAEFARWLQMNRNKVEASNGLVCAAPTNQRSRPLLRLAANPRNPFQCAYPAITTQPKRQQKIVSPGATFTLSCQLSPRASARTAWRLPNRPGLSVPSYRRQATYDPVGHLIVNSDGSLVVYNATTRDTGLYSCATRNSMGSDNITYAVYVGTSAPTTPRILPRFPPVESTAQGSIPRPRRPTPGVPPTQVTAVRPARPTLPPRTGMPPTFGGRGQAGGQGGGQGTGQAGGQGRGQGRGQPGQGGGQAGRQGGGPVGGQGRGQAGGQGRGQAGGQGGGQGRGQGGGQGRGQGGSRTTVFPRGQAPKTGRPKVVDRTQVPTFATWTTKDTGPRSTAFPPLFEGSTDNPGTIVPNLSCLPNPCKNGGTCSAVPAQSREFHSENISAENSIYATFDWALKSRYTRDISFLPFGHYPAPSNQVRCTCPKPYGGALCQIRKPGNPTKVSVVQSGSDVITLSWSQASLGDVSGYRVFYSLVGDRTVVKSIPIHPDVNLYSMNKLKKDATYRICVIAFNQGGDSVIGEDNCIWAETVSSQSRSSNSRIFSTQFIAIASGVVSVFAVILIVAYCYLRAKKKNAHFDEAVVVARPPPGPGPSTGPSEVFRKSLRRPMPSYYNQMDDMMLIDMSQGTNRQMYMNPFDARHSAMLHDMETRRQTQSQNFSAPKIFAKSGQRRTLQIQEDTVL